MTLQNGSAAVAENSMWYAVFEEQGGVTSSD